MDSFRRISRPIAQGLRAVPADIWLIVLFWIAQFGLLTAQRALFADDESNVLLPRALVAMAGMAISIGIARLMVLQQGRSWPVRLFATLLLAMVAALLHAVANFSIFQLFMPMESEFDSILSAYARPMLQWFWVYIAISAMLLTHAYSDALREGERRLAEAQSLAHAAQLRALRYQLNPHFMFNTLNSIASLIAAGDAARAEQMVENLSDFLRASLALDPTDELPLVQELELQSLYLAIEATRFPDRLRVTIDVPERCRDLRVPSLILQPLVENAIKHGVARREAPTTVAISASEAGGRLTLTVRNEAGHRANGGTSVGLANVARRLQARHAGDCGFAAGLDAAGHFVVTLTLPAVRAL